MSTPTFPVAPLDDRPEVFRQALLDLAAGEVTATAVAALSDLDRAERNAFAPVWAAMASDKREAVVTWIHQLAEDRVELSFGRVLRLSLTDPSATVRQMALGSLWEDTGLDLVDPLLKMVRDDDSQDVRAEAAALLGRFIDRLVIDPDIALDPTAIRETLAAIVVDVTGPPLVRRRALEAMSGFGSDEEIDDLIDEFYNEGDSALVAGAIRSMGRTLSTRYLPTVLVEIASDDAEYRYEAALAAGELGDERAIPEVISLLEDEDTEVRAAAVTALGRIGGPNVSHALGLALSRAESDEERDALSTALEEAMLTVDPLEIGPA
ncbi:MAG: HEAT repeat domain-containing protein [Chloroflexia bacterium]|nr:HEAT repeat domain-containing protein [Chloroflexia bacterium]MDQ3514134.1 HEAT repeat domain-containing protein [Chloroflexota bacterium]